MALYFVSSVTYRDALRVTDERGLSLADLADYLLVEDLQTALEQFAAIADDLSRAGNG